MDLGEALRRIALEDHVENLENSLTDEIKLYLNNINRGIKENGFKDIEEEFSAEDRAFYFKKLNELKMRVDRVDKARLDFKRDKVFTKVSWEPLKPGGSESKFKKLKQVNDSIISYKFSIGYLLFIFILSTVLSFMLLTTIELLISQKESVKSFNKILFYSSFIIGLIITINQSLKSITFDKELGYFFIGKKNVLNNIDRENINYCLLNHIHAIQIIKEHCTTKESKSNRTVEYDSYEINLVLKDGNRINVIDHSDLNSINEDVKIIQRYLNVPIWNYDLA